MRIPIVDVNDNLIEYKERDKATNEDIRRISHIWVFNKNREFLIAKRQGTKKVSPNKWGPAAVGSVEEGESYESNAKKEVEEEIGLRNVSFKLFKKLYYENENGKRFSCVFVTSVDMEANQFILQEEEVSEVKWISLEELINWYKKSPNDFIPSMGITISLIKEYQNENKN